jgi:hypothetical protein
MTFCPASLGRLQRLDVLVGKKAFQFHNQTFTSSPAWELAVVPLGTGTGYERIHISLSNKGGPIESSKVTELQKNCSTSYVQVL